jgi:hypothetical protein
MALPSRTLLALRIVVGDLAVARGTAVVEPASPVLLPVSFDINFEKGENLH